MSKAVRQPTIDDFRIERTRVVPLARGSVPKERNIIALWESASDEMSTAELVKSIARKTYSGTIPDETALMFSHEGSPTLDNRLLARFNDYVKYVETVIREYGQGKAV